MHWYMDIIQGCEFFVEVWFVEGLVKVLVVKL